VHATATTTASPDETEWCAERFRRIVDNVATFIRGKPHVIELAAVCMLAEGHLLIDDVPGTGKTSLAKALSASAEMMVRRVQMTPDLLPTDITGVMIYDQANRKFEFHEGPVFSNIVVADEVNRATPKTQSALLEVMEENHVTVDGIPRPVPSPFFVVATENPIEFAGTYRLAEAQNDRFTMRIAMGYPDRQAEAEIVVERTQRRTPETLRPVISAADLRQMIDICSRVHLAPKIVEFIVSLVAATRSLPDLSLGASPRASVALARATQAFAGAQGRHYAIIDDVKALARPVLCHRFILRPEAELDGRNPEGLLASVLDAIPVAYDVAQR
jgi:MoxR-like ATPase